MLAFLLFLFGNAVNVVHFCCDVCRVHGTEVFTQDICHERLDKAVLNHSDLPDPEFHDNGLSHSALKARFPFSLTHQHEVCSMNRFSIALDHILKVIKPVLWMFVVVLSFLMAFSLKQSAHSTFFYHVSPIPLAGRQLLNRICVLRN